MDWNLWVIWTAQGLLWSTLALFFYYMAVRIRSAEKLESAIDKAAIGAWSEEQYNAAQREHEKQLAFAKGEIWR